MQGKPMNAFKAKPDKVLANPLYQVLIESLGAGQAQVFDLTRLRYQRVLLLMDPDADGIHCGALLLLFFAKFMPGLISAGRLGLLRVPVGEIIDTETGVLHYPLTDLAFREQCLALNVKHNAAILARRYRGLAGLSETQLRTWCLQANSRRMEVLGETDIHAAKQFCGHIQDS
jgi:DNA gyrase subunit B